MKFAHVSDCHIGGWKEEKLRYLNMQSFKAMVKIVIERQVDFLLISGDLFNTALPQIEYIKEVTAELKKVKDAHIPLYIVAGSHDFSPSGKTMLDVLEKAGLVQNVMKKDSEGRLQFTIDPNTGAKIAGMLGKRAGLEIKDYETMDCSHLEQEEGFKIFLFHTAINEFKPQGMELMEGANAATLPKNFHYYAGGHVHYVFQKEFGQGWLTYPGALFPNNFKEIEEWQHGGLYIVDEHVKWEYVPIKLKEVCCLSVDLNGLLPPEAENKIIEAIKLQHFQDKIVTLRLYGEIEGKVSDIDFKEIYTCLSGAFVILKNTSKLQSKQIHTFDMKAGTVEEIEEEILKEQKDDLARRLMLALDKEKEEGEKSVDFERRVLAETLEVLGIEAA